MGEIELRILQCIVQCSCRNFVTWAINYYVLQLQIFCSQYMPKITSVSSRQSYCTNKRRSFLLDHGEDAALSLPSPNFCAWAQNIGLYTTGIQARVIRWQKDGPMLKQRWLLGCNQTLDQRRWRNVGPLFHIVTGPTSSANHLPIDYMILAQRRSNSCLLAGKPLKVT